MSTYVLKVYMRDGSFWDRFTGTEADLREQGRAITTQRGQLSWRCSLMRDGVFLASCRRGKWTEAPSP